LPDLHIHWAWASPLATWFDWGLGALVAERFHQGRTTFRRPWLWLAVLGPVFVASTLYKPFTVFSFTLAAAVSAILLDSALWHPWRGGWWMRGLAFLGTISYSLYLWHQPAIPSIVKRIHPLVAWPPATCVVVALLLAGVAWVSYWVVERPGIAIGHRLAGRKREPASRP
jgi:peptidoglycan/LPS O-acetylase OafA/YrhL